MEAARRWCVAACVCPTEVEMHPQACRGEGSPSDQERCPPPPFPKHGASQLGLGGEGFPEGGSGLREGTEKRKLKIPEGELQ